MQLFPVFQFGYYSISFFCNYMVLGMYSPCTLGYIPDTIIYLNYGILLFQHIMSVVYPDTDDEEQMEEDALIIVSDDEPELEGR